MDKGKGKQAKEVSEDEDEDGSFGLKDMIRIKTKSEYPEDVGTGTVNWDMMPLVLTSKAGTVELGGRV